jgi:hypothetical protein
LKKNGLWLAGLSFLATILAGFMTYALRLSPGDDPQWFVALVLLGVTSLITVCDLVRAYFSDRHQAKKFLGGMLNDLSKVLFAANARNNRITLFKLTGGWRTLFWSIVKLPFSKSHKWRALLRLSLIRGKYVGVYLRSQDSRGKNSVAAFRVSDDPKECEGVAGLIWDKAGQVMIPDLPLLDRDAIRALPDSPELGQNSPIKQYVSSTNISDFRILKACDSLARHFYGTLIRKPDGTPWGVLLLDSTEEQCPFIVNGIPSPEFVQRFNDYTRLIGMAVR